MRRSHVGARRLPHVNELQPDVATFMIARAIAETYRDVLNEPVPEKLAAIIRQIQDKERGERVGQGEV